MTKAHQHTSLDYSARQANKAKIQEITADVLSNQQPPYSIIGGLFDALSESQGEVLVADNHEVRQAVELFQEAERIDIDLAAGVAFASLLKARQAGMIDRNALVLLHITGGGWSRCQAENRLAPITPALEIDIQALSTAEALERIARLCL